MKKALLTFALMCLLGAGLLAQVPQGFNYQAIARDNSGNPVTDKTIKVMLSVLSDTLGFKATGAGTYIWEEEHLNVRTNAFGLFTVVMGMGTKTGGSATTFSSINWTLTTLHIGTKIAYPTTSAYKIMGSAKFWTVPYSMVSGAIGTQPKLSVTGVNDALTTDALFEVKRKDGQTVFAVYPNGVNVYVPDDVKGGVRGGFAVGGFERTKGISQDFFTVTPDSVRVYIDNTPDKGPRGGFAVGGFERTKAGSIKELFMNVNGSAQLESITGSPQVLWYPNRNAFLAGNVWIGLPDSVGLYSTSLGYRSLAVGDYSQAFGYKAKAYGDYSTSIGKYSIAGARTGAGRGTSIASNAFAFGNLAKALGNESYAFGSVAEATGTRSFAFGSIGVDTLGVPVSSRTTRASGSYSTAVGMGAQATNTGSMALGVWTTASGVSSSTFGYGSQASGIYSQAMGYYAKATFPYTTAIGYRAYAYNNFATAIGYRAYAAGSYSHSFGYGATATGTASLALGYYSNAGGLYTAAIGFQAKTTADYAGALGRGANASGINSIAIGYNSKAQALNAYSFGTDALASAENSYAIGRGAGATALTSMSVGYMSQATAQNAVAIGNSNTSSGTYSVTLGNTNTAGTNTNAIALGNSNISSGVNSISLGNNNTSSSSYSTAIGTYTTSSNLYSTAIGYYAEALGSRSLSIGARYVFTLIPKPIIFIPRLKGETAKGDIPFDDPDALPAGIDATGKGIIPIYNMNRNNIADGSYSIAVGNGNNSTNGGASFGVYNESSALYSTAIGFQNHANGPYSFAGGYLNQTTGDFATAFGRSTEAQAENSFVIGRYNAPLGSSTDWIETDPLFQIGNGSSTSETHDAFRVLKNGGTYIWTTDATTGLYLYSTINERTSTTYGIYSYVRSYMPSTYYYSGYFNGYPDYNATTNPYYLGLYADYRTGAGIDLAEYIYDSEGNTEAADVVVADPGKKESVLKSSKPYQTSVLGAITTKPHMVMGNDLVIDPETGKHIPGVKATRLALTGRVPVKVSSENGPILPGDNLTSSSTPGTAMKWSLLDVNAAKDFDDLKRILSENEKRRNAIIGKAVEAFSGPGNGKIMVLISPQ